MPPFTLHLLLLFHSLQIHLLSSSSLALCPNPISSNSLSLSLRLCSFHPTIFFPQILFIPPSQFATPFSVSLKSPLSFPHCLTLSTCCPSCHPLFFFFLLFVGRQQDLPPSGCVSVITRGFTQRAVAENRGTKAIGHSTARRLLCHIKGERVIFQLQFTVSCHQLGERCGGVRVHVCVFGCSGASLCVRAAVRLAPHSTDCSVPVCMDTHVSVAGQADECVGVFVVVVSGA